jgi:hypothetical protein
VAALVLTASACTSHEPFTKQAPTTFEPWTPETSVSAPAAGSNAGDPRVVAETSAEPVITESPTEEQAQAQDVRPGGFCGAGTGQHKGVTYVCRDKHWRRA